MVRNNKGFTLVELMVVIVIIGVLAALAIPKFTDASAKAKISEGPTVCGSFDNAILARLGETGTGPAAAPGGWTDLVMQNPAVAGYSKFFTYVGALAPALDNVLTATPIAGMGAVAAASTMGTHVDFAAGNAITHWQNAQYDKYLPNWGVGTVAQPAIN